MSKHKGRFELKRAKNGYFHFDLLAPNGQVLLQSNAHKTKQSALKAIASAKKNAALDDCYAPDADIVDLT